MPLNPLDEEEDEIPQFPRKVMDAQDIPVRGIVNADKFELPKPRMVEQTPLLTVDQVLELTPEEMKKIIEVLSAHKDFEDALGGKFKEIIERKMLMRGPVWAAIGAIAVLIFKFFV